MPPPTHLMVRFTVTDFAEFKKDFDVHAETRRLAGLTLLQMWRDVDDAAAICLFDIHDPARAHTWLDTQIGLDHPVTAQFLRTA